MGYCSFKIVAGGLAFAKTSYESVIAGSNNIFDFLSGNLVLSDAEKANLEKRQKHKVRFYPINEIPFVYKTQNFMLWKTRQIIEIAEYLLDVIKLAEKIAASIRLTAADNEIERYIDLLLEIHADKDNITSSRLCHRVQAAYTELIQTIPKDLSRKEGRPPEDRAEPVRRRFFYACAGSWRPWKMNSFISPHPRAS